LDTEWGGSGKSQRLHIIQNTLRGIKTVICLIKPKEFTKEQIAKCRQCKWASAKIRWCGKHACCIGGQRSRIVVPKKYPSLPRMAGSFAKAAGRQALAGNPRRTPEYRVVALCGDFMRRGPVPSFDSVCHLERATTYNEPLATSDEIMKNKANLNN